MMKPSRPTISVITAVFNRANTIGQAIQSVLDQTYDQVELVVVDGMSNDGTDQVVAQFGERIHRSIREPDKGIYDALNKGVRAASGDVIGFLHADDLMADRDVLRRVAECFERDIDGVYGDLVYVDQAEPEQIRRVWRSGTYDRKKFFYGWMPPHPTVYLHRRCYDQFGLFNLQMETAADYELMVRMMVKHQIRMAYIPATMVRMRVGGKSNVTLANRIRANQDDRKAWLANAMQPPLGLRLLKPLRKLHQFFPFFHQQPASQS